jgi:hypothetical protein
VIGAQKSQRIFDIVSNIDRFENLAELSGALTIGEHT